MPRKQTNLERQVELWQNENNVALTPKESEQLFAKTVKRVERRNPKLLEQLNTEFDEQAPLELSEGHQQFLSSTFTLFSGQVSQQQKDRKQLARASQFQGLLTWAQTANAGLNVASRVLLGAGAYNAQVAGRVIQFEDAQKRWDNIKRNAFAIGSTASLVNAGFRALGGGVALSTGAAILFTTAGQVARIYNENKALSGERKRQDLDAQYHRETYGAIVTRGNR